MFLAVAAAIAAIAAAIMAQLQQSQQLATVMVLGTQSPWTKPAAIAALGSYSRIPKVKSDFLSEVKSEVTIFTHRNWNSLRLPNSFILVHHYILFNTMLELHSDRYIDSV